MADSIPVEAFLDSCAPPMREITERLRAIVSAAVPESTERVRPGWRLIGYDLPIGRRSLYFGWVFPEAAHVHLGFPNGVLVPDPGHILLGVGITKRARWLTFRPGDPIDEVLAIGLVRAAAAVARIPRSVSG